MNKIIVNNIVEAKVIEVSGRKVITVFNESLPNLHIKAKKGSDVVINDFRLIKSAKSDITFTAGAEASIVYNHAFINQGEYKLNIQAGYQNTSSSIEMNIHGINNGGDTNILINGIIGNKAFDNHLFENIRIININGGKCTANPNMLISNSRVIASHNVTIGKITASELEYLMSKGISKASATKLILNGFIIDVIPDPKLTIKIKELIGGEKYVS